MFSSVHETWYLKVIFLKSENLPRDLKSFPMDVFSDFYILKNQLPSAGFEPENLGPQGENVTLRPHFIIIICLLKTFSILMLSEYTYYTVYKWQEPKTCCLRADVRRQGCHYKISREKFEPEPGFEPRTSGFLARRSTT